MLNRQSFAPAAPLKICVSVFLLKALAVVGCKSDDASGGAAVASSDSSKTQPTTARGAAPAPSDSPKTQPTAARGAASPEASDSSKTQAAAGGAGSPSLGETGFTADIPQGYKLERKNDTYFTVEPEGDQPRSVGANFMVKPATEAMPKSADELAKKKCSADDKEATKGALPGGGFFVRCVSNLSEPGAQPNHYVQSVTPAGDRWISCHFMTTGDIGPAEKICRSVRKQ
ncbi:hypothetical protein [Nannocystis exedens]|nr:hypothetical protein [Nannocystis exedens]